MADAPIHSQIQREQELTKRDRSSYLLGHFENLVREASMFLVEEDRIGLATTLLEETGMVVVPATVLAAVIADADIVITGPRG